jgi:hypothetical protein|tara:strand:+ start:2595 stop:3011 length:417 start_codon:yes stop_codon:yes gene_type:complete
MSYRIPIRLNPAFISKKIEPTAFKTALASSHHTAYQLYLITNGFKELLHFFEYTGDEYFVSATVKTEAGFIGEAKKQVWSVKHLQPLMKKKPIYTLRCSVTEKATNKEVYRCVLESKDSRAIYNQIEESITDLVEILI